MSFLFPQHIQDDADPLEPFVFAQTTRETRPRKVRRGSGRASPIPSQPSFLISPPPRASSNSGSPSVQLREARPASDKSKRPQASGPSASQMSPPSWSASTAAPAEGLLSPPAAVKAPAPAQVNKRAPSASSSSAPLPRSRVPSLTPDSAHKCLNVTPAAPYRPRKSSNLKGGGSGAEGRSPAAVDQSKDSGPGRAPDSAWAEELLNRQRALIEQIQQLEGALSASTTEKEQLQRQLSNLSLAKARTSQMALAQIKLSSDQSVDSHSNACARKRG